MRHNRLIAAAAGAAFAAAALVGCSSDDLDKAAQDAKAKGSEALSDAASKGADAGSKAAEDAKKKGSDALSDATGGAGDGASDGADAEGDEAGSGDVTVDLGDFKDDAGAKTVGEFYKLRFEAASGAGDVAALEPITTPERYKSVQKYVENAEGLTGPFAVTVVAVNGDEVDVCAGPNSDTAWTATIVDGKVATNTKGDHTC